MIIFLPRVTNIYQLLGQVLGLGLAILVINIQYKYKIRFFYYERIEGKHQLSLIHVRRKRGTN